MSKRQLHFNVHLAGAGHHDGSWRHPATERLSLDEFERDLEVTRLAERAKLDAVFTADFVSSLSLERSVFLEPLTLMAGLAAATERIGLVATVSTTYFEAYNLARQFASLDHISRGRAGWNVVTSINANAALQFGTEHPPHDERYRRAEEYLDVVRKLWDSWEDDALVADRASGVFVDPEKVHEINHAGQYLKVAGPLNLRRPPQGHPVLVQAGSSAVGISFAARNADAVFTSLHSLEAAQTYYADLKGQMVSCGRRPEELVVLPGLQPIIGDTEAKAKELQDQLLEYTNPAANLTMLEMMLGGADLSDFPLDEPLLPRFQIEHTDIMSHQRIDIITDLARRENLTIRELVRWIAAGHGHRVIVGTPEQIADDISSWFLRYAADGFTIQPPYLPGGLEAFAEQVIPLLQARGLFRTDYEGATLRQHYGLKRPASQYASVHEETIPYAVRHPFGERAPS
jgi:FMN-dependent oxidoreductase (nitrilotriacetate monooxygenase family)